MKYYITGLDAAEALSIGRKVWDVLLPAVNRAPEKIRYTYEELLHEIARKETQVWIVYDPDTDDLAGVLTTSISTDTRFPDLTLLEIPLVAGKDIRGWLGDVLKLLANWGLAHGADIMLAYGRRGWERLAGFDYWGEDNGVRIMTRPIGGYH